MTSRGRVSRRRGSAYLIVLYLMTIAAVTGLALSVVAVRTSRTASGEADVANASMMAQSGLDLVLAESKRDANWRSTRSPGMWANQQSCSTGTITTQVVGSQADFVTDPSEALTITATGEVNGTKRSFQVQARSFPLEVLKSGLHANGDVFIDGDLTTNGPVTSNGNIGVNSGDTLDGDAAAAGSIINMGTITGSTTSGADPFQTPSSDWMNTYVAGGVVIPYSALEDGEIQDVFLSPTSNPLTGVTSPSGVYVIDGEGNQVVVRDCRIVGTLVFQDTPSVKVRFALNWGPAVSGWPALLHTDTGGILQIEINSDLVEADYGTDFNGDGDEDDTFPGSITGLIWSRSDTIVRRQTVINGTLITEGSLGVSDQPAVVYDANLYNNPPPGNLYENSLRIIDGSYIVTTNHLGS